MTIDAATSNAPGRPDDAELPPIIERSAAKLRQEESLEDAQRLLRLRWRAGGWAVREAKAKSPYHLEGAPELAPPDEIQVSDLTPDIARAALARNGNLVLRGLIPQAAAEDFVQRIDRTVDGFQHVVKNKGSGSQSADLGYIAFRPPPPDRKHVADNRKYLAVEEISALTVDSPLLFERLVHYLKASGIVSIAEQIFGERPVAAIQKSAMRRMPLGHPAGWHQDLGAVGAGTKAIALWIPFSPCGRDAAGFEFVRRRFNGPVPQMNDSLMPWVIANDMVTSVQDGADVVTPEFNPGDAMMFDQYSLHRGASYPHMTKWRWSIDTWLFAPSSVPSHITPMYL
jgi:hypothetical protein